jgi:hypothetical protein
MSLDEVFLEKWHKLPVSQQREAIDFIEFLQKKSAGNNRTRSLEGLWANLGIGDISEKDIDDARKECWASFPRDDI